MVSGKHLEGETFWEAKPGGSGIDTFLGLVGGFEFSSTNHLGGGVLSGSEVEAILTAKVSECFDDCESV